jgi:antirestriction protein ArdC
MSRSTQTERADVYTRITAEIVAAIEAGAGTCGAGGITRTSSRAATVQNRAGLSGYVAELGAAFLAADLSLSLEPRQDHASYIADWIKVLKGDKRAIFSAAAHAERAVKFLHGLQPDAQPAGADESDPDRRAFAAQAFEAAA